MLGSPPLLARTFAAKVPASGTVMFAHESADTASGPGRARPSGATIKAVIAAGARLRRLSRRRSAKANAARSTPRQISRIAIPGPPDPVAGNTPPVGQTPSPTIGRNSTGLG